LCIRPGGAGGPGAVGGPAALGALVLPPAPAGGAPGGARDGVAGPQAELASPGVCRDDDGGPPVARPGDRDDRGTGVPEPAADVEGQGAEVVARDLTGVVRDDERPGDVGRAVGDLACPGEELLATEGRELLLGGLEPAHEAGDPLRELLGPAAEQVGHLADEDVLLGLEAVGPRADERVDAAHAGPDGRLAEQGDPPDVAG